VRIYVASSWRNAMQPVVVKALRTVGHEVYDFRHPEPGEEGFHWTAVESSPRPWTAEMLGNALEHPIARAGFEKDVAALRSCDACVLILPCGRSAHLELGWAVGAKKWTVVLMAEPDEPELMYRMVDAVCPSIGSVIGFLEWAAQMRPEDLRVREFPS
jgi:hypothetical protein